MKKRVFSLLLAMVMILSTAALAISATETDTNTETVTKPVAENVNGLIVTVDGVKDAGEGWSATPIFQTKYKVSDPSIIFENATSFTEPDANGNQEAIVEDENPSSLYISTDGKYVYFFYETTHSDFINGHEDPTADGNSWIGATSRSGATTWGAGSLKIFFAPSGVDLEATNVSDHKGFYLNLRTFTDDSYDNNVVEAALTTGNQTYVWDHKLGDDNKAENGGAWDDSQGWSARYFVDNLSNGKNAGVEGVTYANYGQDVLDKTQIAMRVEGVTSKFTKLCVEIAFPISAELSEQLQNGTADYRISTYEQSHRFAEAEVKRGGNVTTVPQHAGYVLSERTLSGDDEVVDGVTYPNWCFTKNCGVTFTLPQTSETVPHTVEPNLYSTVTVDGIMGEDEGWSASPLFQTTINASSNDIQAETTLKQEDANPTTIRISCDGQKVYFFIESTHYDTLNATWYDMNEGKTDENGNPLPKNWQTPSYYLHFYPDNSWESLPEYGVDNGHWFTAAFTTFRWYGLKDDNLDENGTLIWDMNNPAGDGESLFWRLLYGPESTMQYSKDFCLAGVELAAHVDKDENGERTKLSIEFAFPLATEVVEALEAGDLAYKVAFYERTNRYMDMSEEEPKWVSTMDGGYFINDKKIPSRLVVGDYEDCGIPITLKQNTDTTYSDFVKWFDEYKAGAEYDNLENLVVNFLGDDYFDGGNISDYYKWTTMIDEIYNWDITNYVEKGIMTSTYDNLQTFPLCRLYNSMASNNPNVIVVSGGLNDYLNGAPIGTINDTKTNTYMGALNSLIDGLRGKYRDACIVFTTVYNFEGSIEGSTLTSEDYATALKEVCEYKKVYCLDLYDAETYGIDMSSAEFRAEYCQSADDTVNLNLEGNKLLLVAYEKFISESLTDWAENKEELLAAWEATKPASGNNGGNTGNNGNNGDTGNNGGDTNNKPAETTPAPAPVEPEKKGCKGVIGVGSALAVLAIVSCAGAVCFKKHD